MKKPPARKSTTARKSASATPKPRKAVSKLESPSDAHASVGPSEAPRASKNILTAGIKALANAHGEAVARQSRVFESLLGLGQKREPDRTPGEKPSSVGALDPFGFKKFEDVFDQRVLRTLQRLGVPSAEAFAALTAELERLREELAHLKSPGRKR